MTLHCMDTAWNVGVTRHKHAMQNLCTSLTIAPNSHVISRKFSPNHSGQHFNQTKSQMSRGCQAFFTQSRPPGISGFNPQSAIFSTSPPLWKKKNKKLVQHFTWIYCCDLYGWIPIFPHQKTRLESISSTSGHVFFSIICRGHHLVREHNDSLLGCQIWENNRLSHRLALRDLPKKESA